MKTARRDEAKVLQNTKLSPFVPVASARDRVLPQGTPFGPSVHLRRIVVIPYFTFAILPRVPPPLSCCRTTTKTERKREKEWGGGSSSLRYHKSFEVLICSHTRRLFRTWHPPIWPPRGEAFEDLSVAFVLAILPTLFVLRRARYRGVTV